MPLLASWLAVWVTVLSAQYVEVPITTPRWQVVAAGRGQPAVMEDTAWFLTRTHDVFAVDIGTGRLRWRRSTGEPGDETLGSSVVAVDARIVAGDYALLAMDARSGERLWRFEPSDGYGPGLYLGDAGHGLVFAGSPAGRLYAVRAEDGVMAWSYRAAAEPKTTVFEPVSSGIDVAAGYTTFGSRQGGGVILVDRDTGQERWRREFPGRGEEATGFGGGVVFCGDAVIASSGDGEIHAFDCRTGRLLWTLPAVVRSDGRRQERDWRALAASGTTLVAGSASGIITAWDVETRRERWRYAHPDGGSTGGHLTAGDAVLYVPHLGGRLVSIDLRDGRPRWQTGGWADGFIWAPTMSRRGVYAVGSHAGLVELPH